MSTTSPIKPVLEGSQRNPWPALWVLIIGFFMILVDSTIVSVANPAIKTDLDATYNQVIWVTSAYLLAYAVPLLLTGRMGDRFGPKWVYIIGLFIFTGGSLWCGLSDTVKLLIAARVLQGVGASLMSPQTMSVITKTFPAAKRGAAMSLWGATAGVAMLVGPLAGGVLVDNFSWHWIFLVNVPVGIVGLLLAIWLVPNLPTTKTKFDILGVILSGIGLFLLVYGIQEGESNDWDTQIWATIGAGVIFLVVFILWEAITRGNPLVPLRLFKDRNFSVSSADVAILSFVITSLTLPLMFFAQMVLDYTPTESALIMLPMALMTMLLAPFVGKLIDRVAPRLVVAFGFIVLTASLVWFYFLMTPEVAGWIVYAPSTLMGVGLPFLWAPLAATATRNLPMEDAGSGSGVYNTTRQIGAVLGAAAMGTVMTSRLTHHFENVSMPGGGSVDINMNLTDDLTSELASKMPPQLLTQFMDTLTQGFSDAMRDSMLLCIVASIVGLVVSLFLVSMKAPADLTDATTSDSVTRTDAESDTEITPEQPALVQAAVIDSPEKSTVTLPLDPLDADEDPRETLYANTSIPVDSPFNPARIAPANPFAQNLTLEDVEEAMRFSDDDIPLSTTTHETFGAEASTAEQPKRIDADTPEPAIPATPHLDAGNFTSGLDYPEPVESEDSAQETTQEHEADAVSEGSQALTVQEIFAREAAKSGNSSNKPRRHRSADAQDEE